MSEANHNLNRLLDKPVASVESGFLQEISFSSWLALGSGHGGQILDLMIKIGADAANGPGVGLDGLRLQALKLKVLEVGLVLALEL